VGLSGHYRWIGRPLQSYLGSRLLLFEIFAF